MPTTTRRTGDDQMTLLASVVIPEVRRNSSPAGIFMIMHGSLYGELCFYENLLEAFRRAAKSKSSKWYVMEFRKDLKNNLLRLQKELISQTYEPQAMKTFVIHDPKTRVISASAFRDRIVHHALCNIIEPIFDRTFIYDSYANRKSKGTHAALRRFDCFKRKVSSNGRLLQNAKDRNMIYGYCLKADIKHYFDSVDHEIMMQIIKRKIKDDKMLWLIKKILSNHISEKGMPIGNLTSQLFANVYLNELDRFVKHVLKAKYYIRYVDDFVILDASKEKLESYKSSINGFLNTIKLEMHPEKSKVIPLQSGVNLLGFRVFYNYRLPKKSNLRLVRDRIGYFIGLYRDGIMTKEEIVRRIEGWNTYAIHGNTFDLRRRISRRLRKSLSS